MHPLSCVLAGSKQSGLFWSWSTERTTRSNIVIFSCSKNLALLNGLLFINPMCTYLLKQWSTPAVTESELELGFFIFFLRPTSRPADNKRAVGTRGAGAVVHPPPPFWQELKQNTFSPSEGLELKLAPPDFQAFPRFLNKARKKKS